MFVFPAFDSNYKTRKRTFQCCQNCRNKRIKCEITSKDYENLGCLTCRKHKWSCSLIRHTVATVLAPAAAAAAAAVVEAPVQLQKHHHPAPPAVHAAHRPQPPPVHVRATNFSSSLPYIPHTYQSPPAHLQRVPSITHAMMPHSTVSSHLHSYQSMSGVNGQNVPISPINSVHTMGQNTVAQLPMAQIPISQHLGRTHPSPLYPVSRHSASIAGIAGISSRTSISSNSSISNDPPADPETEILEQVYGNEYHKTDIENVTAQYLKERFNFNTSGQDSDSKYQLVTHGHPRAVIENASKDKTIWHESGVYIKVLSDEKHKSRYLGSNAPSKSFHIRNKHIYKFLLDLRAFSLSSEKYRFTYDDMLSLVKIYFHKINSVFPLVHEDLFWQKFNAGKCQNALLYSMILSISRDDLARPIFQKVFARNSESASEPFEVELVNFMTDLEYKTRQIILVLPQLGDDDKFSSLIVSLILSLHFNFDKFGSEQSSHDLTDGINLAVNMGIHMKRLSKNLDNEKAEYTTNLWWCLYVLDRFNSIVNQRCIFIKQEDFNLELPYSNTNLMKLIQLARSIEHMSYAIYQPFSDKLKEEERYKLFDSDEFQRNEFEFCEKEQRQQDITLYEDTSNYADNTIHFLGRMVNNVVLMCAQKAKYDDESISNEIPFTISLRSSRNILWYLNQMKDEAMINIPIVPWCISLAMAVALKKEAKGFFMDPEQQDSEARGLQNSPNAEDPAYAFEKYMLGLERFRNTWCVVDEIYRLSRDFMDKLHHRKGTQTSRRKRQRLNLQSPQDLRASGSEYAHASNYPVETPVGTPPTSKSESILSIKNMVHQEPSEFDFGPSPGYPVTPSMRTATARAGSTSTSTSLEDSDIAFGQYDQYFDSMQFDIFNNDFFKNVPNVINLLN